MMIAFVDTPDELRKELVTLLEWRIKCEHGSARTARLARDRTIAHARAMALTNFLDELQRITIASKAEDRRPSSRAQTVFTALNGQRYQVSEELGAEMEKLPKFTG